LVGRHQNIASSQIVSPPIGTVKPLPRALSLILDFAQAVEVGQIWAGLAVCSSKARSPRAS
jgi:hypothetical protein